MKRMNFLLLGMIFWVAFPAGAEVYRYVDDEGVAHFTNDLSTIPENKLSQVAQEAERQKEIAGESPIGPANHMRPGPSFRSPDVEDINRKAETLRKKKLKADKAALETEYGLLLKEKAAIDNDAGFQKRRDKRKYKHRPHIEERVKKEEETKKRLAEIELEIKNIESQL